jgi:ParB family chromosome partitioning protein
MKTIVSVDPFRCRMWELHDRLEHDIDENSCRSEIESFRRHGQLVPVLGRPLQGDPDFEVELIYGARRLFVSRHLNQPLRVEMRQVSNAEGIIAMDIENRHRRDISPYERGRSYLRWLRGGCFKSQDDIARALGVSASQVSRLLKLAQLPTVVIAAFRSPVDIYERWAFDLAAALEDPQRRAPTLARARAISALSSRPPGREIYRQLLAASLPGRKTRMRPHDDVIRCRDDRPLFRVRHHSNTVALMLPVERVSAQVLTLICAAVAGVLQETEPKKFDPSTSRVEIVRAQGDSHGQPGDLPGRQEPAESASMKAASAEFRRSLARAGQS